MTVEEISVILTAKANDLKSKIKSTSKDLKEVGQQTKKSGAEVDKGTSLMNKALNSIETKGAVNKLDKVNKKIKETGKAAQKAGGETQKGSSKIKAVLESIGAGAVGASIAGTVIMSIAKAFKWLSEKIKECTEKYSQAESAQSGLNSILDAQGKSTLRAKLWLEEYVKDGLIPMTDAYAAYKNLASAGYTDEQTHSILQNLKDASAYGRQGNLTMGEAVKSATEGIKNENSVLVDNAGVSKNLSVIWEEYAATIGKSTANLTDEEKRLATVNGLMRETAYQTGNAAEYSKSFAGAQAALKAQTTNLGIAVGSVFAPALKSAIGPVTNLTQKLTALAQKAGAVMSILFSNGENKGGSVKAQKAVQSEIKSTEKISGGWNKANKAAKAYQSRLLGIDEIHRLGSPSSPQSQAGESEDSPLGLSSAAMQTPLSDADKIIDPKLVERAEKLREKIDKLKTLFEKFINPLKTNIGQLKDGLSILYSDGVQPLMDAVFGKDWDIEPDTELSEYLGSTLKWALIDLSDVLGLIASVINGDFSGAWEHLKDLFWDNRVDDFSEKLDILKEKFEGVKTKVSETTDNMKEKFSTAYDTVETKTEDFYNNKIAPWFTREKWDDIFYNIGVSFGEKVNYCITFWNDTLPTFIEEDVKPWFTKEKWAGIYDNIKTALIEKWDQLEYIWNVKIKGWWNNKVAPWFTKEKWVTLGNNIKEGIIKGFEGAVNGLVGILNRGIGKLETWGNNIIGSINSMIDGFNSVSVVKANRIKPITFGRIPAYKYGGFPEEGPFLMNRNELVGKFSNGKTAVANNMQIIEGIKGGVAQGVREALSFSGFGSFMESVRFVLDIVVRNEHGDLLTEINDINMREGRTVIAVDL